MKRAEDMAKTNEVKIGIIRVACGTLTPFAEAEGTLKHPYCRPCFRKVWNDDLGAYSRWLALGMYLLSEGRVK